MSATDELSFQARLFGTFSLAASDGTNALPTGRKARALLACLLLAGDEGLTRERLAGLLWSRSGEEQARASLRQAFYDLRALTAGDTPAIVVDRIAAKAVRGAVRSDLDLLREAAAGSEASALADALGDELRELLADLNGIDDSLDDWLQGERQRRADQRRSTLLAVGEAGMLGGDARGAQRLATSLLASDPTDEAAAQLAMRAAHRLGDRDGVRQVFTRLDKALREELGIEPSSQSCEVHRAALSPGASDAQASASIDPPAATQAAKAEPPTVAAPPAAPALGPIVPADARPKATSTPLPTKIAPLPTRRRGIALAAGFALMLVAAAGSFWQRSLSPHGPRLLLVRPLATTEGDSAGQALAGGFPTDLARMIVGNDSTLAVVDPESASRVAGRGSDLLVSGDATTDAGTLRVNVKLRRARETTILWSSSFSRPSAEAAVLREEIAAKVAGVIVCGFGGKRPAPDDFDAQTMQLYLGACEQKYGDWAEAAKLLQQVVARRPDYAHGWAMLAAGTSTAAYFRPALAAELHQQAIDHAKRAIALDPNDGEAYFAQADALPGISHWTERMTILDAGHAVDPGNSSVNGSRGSELAKVGRWHEAIAATQQAVDAEPFSPVQTSNLARLRAFGGSAEAAEPLLAIGRKRFPLTGYFARSEFRIAALLGDPRRAAAMLDDPRFRLASSPAAAAAWKALIQARLDPSTTNVELAVQKIRDDAQRSKELMPALQKLMALSLTDDAYRLAASVSDRSDSGQELLFAQSMAPFRADPRFMTLAARQGLVTIWQGSDRWPDFCADKSLPYDCRAEARRAVSPEARAL